MTGRSMGLLRMLGGGGRARESAMQPWKSTKSMLVFLISFNGTIA